MKRRRRCAGTKELYPSTLVRCSKGLLGRHDSVHFQVEESVVREKYVGRQKTKA
jgi:hypothetical protein